MFAMKCLYKFFLKQSYSYTLSFFPSYLNAFIHIFKDVKLLMNNNSGKITDTMEVTLILVQCEDVKSELTVVKMK